MSNVNTFKSPGEPELQATNDRGKFQRLKNSYAWARGFTDNADYSDTDTGKSYAQQARDYYSKHRTYAEFASNSAAWARGSIESKNYSEKPKGRALFINSRTWGTYFKHNFYTLTRHAISATESIAIMVKSGLINIGIGLKDLTVSGVKCAVVYVTDGTLLKHIQGAATVGAKGAKIAAIKGAQGAQFITVNGVRLAWAGVKGIPAAGKYLFESFNNLSIATITPFMIYLNKRLSRKLQKADKELYTVNEDIAFTFHLKNCGAETPVNTPGDKTEIRDLITYITGYLQMLSALTSIDMDFSEMFNIENFVLQPTENKIVVNVPCILFSKTAQKGLDSNLTYKNQIQLLNGFLKYGWGTVTELLQSATPDDKESHKLLTVHDIYDHKCYNDHNIESITMEVL